EREQKKQEQGKGKSQDDMSPGEQIKSGYVPDDAEAIGAGKSKSKNEGGSRFTIDKQKLQEKVNNN
ncbi:MAG TPA: hypothetical protein PK289_11690, partial [Bacteroidia bacterium]|nr:hypothetical protein [Bacteroidia bacterium]